MPAGTRQVPLLFGGYSARALDRMVRWGEGYIGGSLPTAMTAPSFEAAKRAWREAGRQGVPKLVVLTYFALGDTEAGLANIQDFYRLAPKEIAANAVLRTTRGTIEQTIAEYTDLGIDEIIFVPATDDLDDVDRLAEIRSPSLAG